MPNVNYNKAMTALNNNQFDEAYELFDKLDGFKDSYDMLDEVQYQKGLYLYNQGKWQESIDILSEFSYYDDRYDDAEDIIDKARDKMTDETYQKALEYEKNGNRSQAIELYETIDSYKDSEERINALKYAYVLENKNNTNSTTYEYLKDLKYDNYKNSKEIYNSLYAWKVSIVVNTSANDDTTNRTSISRSSPIYFHIKLSGGPPSGSTRVRYSYELPNGRTGSGSHDGYWNAGSSGTNYWEDGLYQNPAYGETGNLKMEYRDSDGNVIGSVTVRITR
jgi:tetratricopeptide (TPR) repeat protein